MEEQTSHIGQTLKQCIRVKDFSPVTVYWPCNSNTPSLCFKIFNRLTTWAPVLQLLQGSVEIWVQFCSCKVFTYHEISSINLLLTMLTTTWWQWIAYTFHGMGVIAYVILGRSTVRRSLCRAVKMDELQAIGHNYIWNCVTFFCGDRPLETLNTKCSMLRWHQSNNRSSVENFIVVSLSTPSMVC